MSARRQRQRGQALLLLVAILALSSTWYMVKRLEEMSANTTASDRARNAAVLYRAKQALIGYVALQAAKAGENNPGALPCPEAAAYFDDPTRDGQIAPSCSLPKVGRFPWRTIGTDKLVDTAGEPLWYVVGSGWAYASSSTVINSDTVGQLTVDGAANDSVALIIAPGPAFSVAAASGCTARSQVRPTTGTPDWRNYLECENATYPTPDATFVTTGPSASFNDQVVRITVADIMPAIEAAIANRIEREIAPALKTVYTPTGWGFSGSNPVYPFAAPFANPATSAMQGASGTLTGLLPATYAETYPTSGVLCTPGATAPRCDPNFVSWSSATMSGASIYSQSCTTTATQISCTYYYICPLLGCGPTSVPFTLVGNAANVGMAMRQLNSATTMTNVDASARTVAGTLNSDGSATITLNATATAPGSGLFVSVLNAFCGLIPLDATFGCLQSTISVPITLIADHPILDSRTASSNGWFVRNKWHEVTYYAVVSGHTTTSLPTAPSCTNGSTCLSITNVTPTGAQRAILILAGRSINGSARPSATPGDYLEFGNATAAYERQPVSRAVAASLKKPFNDRIVVVDSN